MVEKHTSEVYARFFIQMSFGNSLVVQWLGLDTFTAVVQVQFLVWELRAYRSCSVAKQNKTKLKKHTHIKTKNDGALSHTNEKSGFSRQADQ